MATQAKPLERSGGLLGAATMRILLAYDGSEHAQAAVDLLRDLRLSPQCEVTILAVMPTQHITGHERLQVKVKETAEALKAKGIQVISELKAGDPASSINEMAQEIRTNLIVVGAKGLRATLGILLGGVAQQVVEYSCCPVLVVRSPYQGLRQVLLVTDGSPFSWQAVECLAPLAAEGEKPRFPLPLDAEVRVMHVLPPPVTPDMVARSWTVGPEALFPVPPQTLDVDALEAREAEEGQALLSRTLEALRVGGIQAKSVMPRGDAATEIIEYVREHKVDLVIGGSRGLNPVTGWLLGSVSRKLVHYAGCSVMIVKSPPE